MLSNLIFRIIAVFMCFISSFSGLTDATEPQTKQYELHNGGTTEMENGRVGIHDPSIIKDGDTYYLFGTHLCAAKSTDLINWTDVACGVSDDNPLFRQDGKTLRQILSEPLSWPDAYQTIMNYNESNWETNIWAPQVIYNSYMDKYCYYSCSTVWGTTASVIWFATADNIEGPYTYEKAIVYSGFNNRTLEGKYVRSDSMHFSFTNMGELMNKGIFSVKELQNGPWYRWDGSYNSEVYPNCIDPNVFYDEDGQLWMSYGSYFGGIYVMPLCEKTGTPDYDKMKNTPGYDIYFGKKIITTAFANDLSGEGPYIQYDPQTDYYYLFVSYGGLNATGGYNMREYRSKKPDGPYVDAGYNLASENANTGLKLMGSYNLDCLDTAYLAAGHGSVFAENGKLFNVYHTRFNSGYENYEVRIHQLMRTKSNWLVMLPFEYKGESINEMGYTLSEIAGEYEFIAHGNTTFRTDNMADRENIIAPTQHITLNENGTITGLQIYHGDKNNTALSSKQVSGNWKIKENTPYITLVIDNVKYEGVLCRQKDESAQEKEVLVFSAISETNETIWGVHK